MIKGTIEQIKHIKNKLGDRVIIPAHHYQVPQIVALADFVGDSYKLALECSRTDSEFIIFCGVNFMAEVANILGKPHQKVLIPDISSGCPLADTIDGETVARVYKKISSLCERQVMPVVYINSSAEVKSFCGEKGGSVCTSSNAAKITEHFLDKGKAVFFSPDFNLGINTARKLQISDEKIVNVKRDSKLETTGNIKSGTLFIWDGSCYVHKEFTLADVESLRGKYPDINIIVHPECDEDVVNLADISSSTQKIYDEIKKAPSGSIWGVGTEYHFVERITREFSDRQIMPLRKSICVDMAKISPNRLLDSLVSVSNYLETKGTLKYEIKVPESFKENAALALKKMIQIVED
ncbi:MAG: quinolinate synthase NadA [Candidatus Cloacimonetes bacterium]|nr:quinolinate synthase NadA [Candidatus Cloacimonadota bacterium]